jgi:hypothetical protein
MSEKLTAQQLEYYKKPAKGLKLTSKEMDNIDADLIESISNDAGYDVRHALKLKDKSAFNNDAEYKYYLLSAYSAARAVEHGF